MMISIFFLIKNTIIVPKSEGPSQISLTNSSQDPPVATGVNYFSFPFPCFGSYWSSPPTVAGSRREFPPAPSVLHWDSVPLFSPPRRSSFGSLFLPFLSLSVLFICFSLSLCLVVCLSVCLSVLFRMPSFIHPDQDATDARSSRRRPRSLRRASQDQVRPTALALAAARKPPVRAQAAAHRPPRRIVPRLCVTALPLC